MFPSLQWQLICTRVQAKCNYFIFSQGPFLVDFTYRIDTNTVQHSSSDRFSLFLICREKPVCEKEKRKNGRRDSSVPGGVGDANFGARRHEKQNKPSPHERPSWIFTSDDHSGLLLSLHLSSCRKRKACTHCWSPKTEQMSLTSSLMGNFLVCVRVCVWWINMKSVLLILMVKAAEIVAVLQHISSSASSSFSPLLNESFWEMTSKSRVFMSRYLKNAPQTQIEVEHTSVFPLLRTSPHWTLWVWLCYVSFTEAVFCPVERCDIISVLLCCSPNFIMFKKKQPSAFCQFICIEVISRNEYLCLNWLLHSPTRPVVNFDPSNVTSTLLLCAAAVLQNMKAGSLWASPDI